MGVQEELDQERRPHPEVHRLAVVVEAAGAAQASTSPSTIGPREHHDEETASMGGATHGLWFDFTFLILINTIIKTVSRVKWLKVPRTSTISVG